MYSGLVPFLGLYALLVKYICSQYGCAQDNVQLTWALESCAMKMLMSHLVEALGPSAFMPEVVSVTVAHKRQRLSLLPW